MVFIPSPRFESDCEGNITCWWNDDLKLGVWTNADLSGSYRISNGTSISEANNAWGTIRDLTAWIYLMTSFGRSYKPQTN